MFQISNYELVIYSVASLSNFQAFPLLFEGLQKPKPRSRPGWVGPLVASPAGGDLVMKRLCRMAMTLALAAGAAAAYAQGTGGALTGTATDQQGLALPGASIGAQNTATGFSRTVTTSSSGSYSIPGLPVGTYEVKVSLTGFTSQTRKAVVNVNTTTAVDFRLAVSTMSEELTVTAETPLIDSKASGVGEVVTGVQIENLPLNGRQFGNLDRKSVV